MKNKYYFHKFKYCPVCGTKYLKKEFRESETSFSCNNCGYTFYQNKTPTAAAIIPRKNKENELLFTTRNIEPNKGKLDLPGGFLKYEEELEDGLIREIYEELGIKIKIVKLLDALITKYFFRNSLYLNITVYYITKPIERLPAVKDKNENSDVKFIDVFDLEKFKASLAFESDYKALLKYKNLLSLSNH